MGPLTFWASHFVVKLHCLCMHLQLTAKHVNMIDKLNLNGKALLLHRRGSCCLTAHRGTRLLANKT